MSEPFCARSELRKAKCLELYEQQLSSSGAMIRTHKRASEGSEAWACAMVLTERRGLGGGIIEEKFHSEKSASARRPRRYRTHKRASEGSEAWACAMVLTERRGLGGGIIEEKFHSEKSASARRPRRYRTHKRASEGSEARACAMVLTERRGLRGYPPNRLTSSHRF